MLEELGALASLADGELLVDCCGIPGRSELAPRARASRGLPRGVAAPVLAHAQAAAGQAALNEDLGRELMGEVLDSMAMVRELGAVSASLLAAIGVARVETTPAIAAVLAELDRHASRIDCLGRWLQSKLHSQHGQCRAMAAQTAIATATARALCGQIESTLDRI